MFDIKLITSNYDTDCGPACLKMLLEYYNIEIPLNELNEECGVRIKGCSAKDLLQVGRAHGLNMIAFKMDAEELIQQDRPAIIWWHYSHWVVFCGKDNNGNVVIANPSRGRFGIDTESFSKLYTGVSLWNGEPEALPVVDTATIEDYEQALSELGVNI